MYVKWGFRAEESIKRGQEQRTTEWHKALIWPGHEELYGKLFADEPIEWNRIGHFQDVTMRQIAERVLPDSAGTTYVDHEIVNEEFGGIRPPTGRFHLYCSALNLGSKSLVLEVGMERDFKVSFEDTSFEDNELYVTTDVANLPECDHMLLYLTGQTWTRAEASAALAEER